MKLCYFILLLLLYHTNFIVLLAAIEDHGINLENFIKTKNLSTHVLPIIDPADKVTIEFDLFLNQLLALDGTKQTLKISAYTRFAWHEKRITWNPDDFGGIDVLDIDFTNMWYPKPFVYNGVGDSQMIKPERPITVRSLNANLSYCMFAVKRDIEVTCIQNLKKFPNDKQECQVILLVYDMFRPTTFQTKTSAQHAITNYTAMYIASNEWDLVGFTQGPKYHRTKMTTQPDGWISLEVYGVHLTFQRIYDYYLYTIIVPLLLLTFLQLLVFFIPIESGEKMSLGITILLSFTIFLLIMDNIIPKNKDMPQITYFITYSMTLSSSCLILTGFVMRLYYTDENTPMSNLTRTVLIQGLARVMCMKIPPSVIKSPQKSNKVEVFEEEKQNGTCDEQLNPWKVAALALERLMVYVGIVIIMGVSCGFLIPPFY